MFFVCRLLSSLPNQLRGCRGFWQFSVGSVSQSRLGTGCFITQFVFVLLPSTLFSIPIMQDPEEPARIFDDLTRIFTAQLPSRPRLPECDCVIGEVFQVATQSSKPPRNHTDNELRKRFRSSSAPVSGVADPVVVSAHFFLRNNEFVFLSGFQY